MGDIAVAGGVAVVVLFLTGVLPFRALRQWGIILGTALAVVTFLTLLGT